MPRNMHGVKQHRRSKKSKKRAREKKSRKVQNPCRSLHGWKQEKCEHPWATKRQAKQIERDHERIGKKG